MGVKIKVNTLSSYLEKLERTKKLDKLSDEIINNIANEGVKIARDKYTSTDMNVNVYIEESSVVASADGLAFEEYGTGSVGRDSDYKGTLPTQTISFRTSKGAKSTQGWVYNYKSPHKILSRNGIVKGWFNPKTKRFTRGQKAGQQMYDTSVDLRSKVSEITHQTIKGFINNE